MPTTASSNLQRIQKGYAFLRKHAEEGTSFTVPEAVKATGWAESSVKTYIPKQWRDYMERVGTGTYKVSREFLRLNEEDFVRLVSQNRTVFSKYRRVEFSSVVSYEFLLPLTKENELREALDSLFYADTIQRRLEEIGLATVREWLPPGEGEAEDAYVKRVCKLVSEKFGGYSISHVNGRFLASELKTRTEVGRMLADDQRYLIDETTAVVRFIVPLVSSKQVDQSPSGGFSFEDIGEAASIDEELQELRALLFNIFAEAIVKIVQGEDEIWLVEDSIRGRRLYKWEKN